MLKLPHDPRYDLNRSRSKDPDGASCLICGKDQPNPRKFIAVFFGATQSIILTQEESDKFARAGMGPVCATCLAKYPDVKPYTAR